MPLESDLKLNAFRLDPANIDPKVLAVNEKLAQITKAGPSWVEVGAPTYRQMRLDGKTPFPKPTTLAAGKAIQIPSRESGRTIPCRLFYPSTASGDKPRTKGVVMHIHGGGWVLMSHETSDPLLQMYADISGCAAISVGYRLAPEHPFPAGPDDCYDAAEWLADNAEKEYGGPLRYIGGESAGGHLSLLSAYHLLRTRPSHKLAGLLLHFGAFDLSLLPHAQHFTQPLVLNRTSMENFFSAFVPHLYPINKDSHLGFKDPKVSPYYEDLEQWRGKLPPALFTVGSMDALLEDSVNMCTRWCMAGGQGVLKILEGAVHGYLGFDEAIYPIAGVGKRFTADFIRETMGDA